VVIWVRKNKETRVIVITIVQTTQLWYNISYISDNIYGILLYSRNIEYVIIGNMRLGDNRFIVMIAIDNINTLC
jgi:hypothetical protein